MRLFVLSCCLLFAAIPAAAANVNLQANLINSCVLSLSSNGTMTANTAGTQIGSENASGSAASLGLVAIGSLPTVTYAAPSLSTSPAGWTASHTDSIRYTSNRGANQAYTSSQSSVTAGGLTETFTVHGKVDSANGFDAGNYTLTTVVTCSQ
ncbi:MAG: hypothetical protein ABI617_04985 [Sphingomicrobium sp.]